MMRHLCATRLSEDGFLYLRDSFLRRTAHESKRQENIKTDFESRVAKLFGIDAGIVKQAVKMVR
jgi:hypothetical protein